jgi:hypothetical protein
LFLGGGWGFCGATVGLRLEALVVLELGLVVEIGLFELVLEGQDEGGLVLELGLEGSVVLGDIRYFGEELLVQL